MKGHSPGRKRDVTRTVLFTCQQCGKEVERSRERAGKARFCSLACAGAYGRARYVPDGKVTVTCAGCGEPFEKWKAWLRNAGPDALHFHNLACRRHYRATIAAEKAAAEQALIDAGVPPRLRPSTRRNDITKQCEICGKDFTVPQARAAARYCSMQCAGVGHSQLLTGRRTVETWKSTAFRGMIRAQFVDRCAVCGWDEARNDVCHIVARKDGGEDAFENIVMLCPNHHRLFDTKKISPEAIIAARPNCLKDHSDNASL